ncbi:hypothetical protein H4R34_001169 [Dimargaris verticillata]|uniref:Rab proteins geranylgeranyltransferase component n=1 Tax=Dimargaris verticillata TaxID=2761393 RepID=A0A9W8B5A1_9FUNG|nr:hypothetical protein H4R34_001169 [Dimargaris verticillata]
MDLLAGLDETVYDCIVLGTGLTESIVAGALARSGRRVLHLDTNDYYGADWACFDLSGLCNWYFAHQATIGNKFPSADPTRRGVRVSPMASAYSAWEWDIHPAFTRLPDALQATLDDATAKLVQAVHAIHTGEQLASVPTEPSSTLHTQAQAYRAAALIFLAAIRPTIQSHAMVLVANHSWCTAQGEFPLAASSFWLEAAEYLAEDYARRWLSIQSVGRSARTPDHYNLAAHTLAASLGPAYITLCFLLGRNREFNVELAPKLAHCRGPMVNVLVASGVGKYLEFRGVDHTYLIRSTDQHLIRAPNSKEDIFTSRDLSLVDKRLLMRCITAIQDPALLANLTPEDLAQEMRPWLQSRFKLGATLLDAVLYTVALADPALPPLTVAAGIDRIQRYLSSMGRFGRMALLYPVYGGGAELAQAFCRLAAVNGGIYVLDGAIQDIQACDPCLLSSGSTGQADDNAHAATTAMDSNDAARDQGKARVESGSVNSNKVASSSDPIPRVQVCTRDHQTLRAHTLVASQAYLPTDWVDHSDYYPTMARGIIILSRPLVGIAEDATLFAVPPSNPSESAQSCVYGLQLSKAACATPAGLAVVHLMVQIPAHQADQSAKVLLEPVVHQLIHSSHAFRSTVKPAAATTSPKVGGDLPELVDEPSKMLWSLYYKCQHPGSTTLQGTAVGSQSPKVLTVPGPSPVLCFADAVDQARALFYQILDDPLHETEFLPPMPDPEDGLVEV